jgi:outer membrane protein OmpA-like peptidoglycan-associated protein
MRISYNQPVTMNYQDRYNKFKFPASEYELIPGIENFLSFLEINDEIKRRKKRNPPPKRPSGSSSAPSTQPAQPVSKIDCKKLLTLDNFETSHYRMLPRHYEPLMNFLLALESSPPPPGTTILIVGHTDDQGPELMNEGISINRALEVKRFVDHVVTKLVTTKRLPRIIPTEVFARGESDKVSPSPQKNRRVELGLCKPI